MPARSKMPVFEVVVTTLPGAGFPARLAPNETERAAIAEAVGVTRFVELEADLLVRRWRRDGVEISGEIRARAEQPCVVTLEPVIQDIDEGFRTTFLPQGSRLAKPSLNADRELLLDPEGDDPPETFTGDSIDLWTVAVEWLNLAVDRFPRAPGAELPDEATREASGPGEGKVSPFAELAKLRKDQG